MVTTLALPRLLPGGRDLSLRRAAAMTERDLMAFRHTSYWWLVLSGFAEPLLYLFAIGVGVGALVGDMTLPDGRTISYPAFVAPAMLATAAMNGALAESTFNFFAKMKFAKLYDAILNTPLTPMEIAFGELGWAMLRGAMYSAVFLGVMVAMDLTTVVWALAAFPATLLVGFAFGALGMALATFMRTWQDFDYVGVAQFALFLFSATFVPLASYPAVFQFVVHLTPLYHGVALLRGLTTGVVGVGMAWHVGYLVLVTALGLAVAGRRMARALCR